MHNIDFLRSKPKMKLSVFGHNMFEKPAIAAMHGPHSVFDMGHCTIIHGNAGGVSLVDQRKAEKNQY